MKEIKCPVCESYAFDEEEENTLRCMDCMAVISQSGELLEVA